MLQGVSTTDLVDVRQLYVVPELSDEGNFRIIQDCNFLLPIQPGFHTFSAVNRLDKLALL